MQIEELYELTNWVEREIVKRKINQKFKQLHKILQQNAQANQQKQPFEEQQKELIDSLAAVALTELSTGQIEVLSRIGIGSNIGREGVSKVEDTLFRNALDIASAAQYIQQSMQEIEEGVQWSKQIREHISKIIDTESVIEIGENVLLRVNFANDANISNLTEFKEWGKTWWEIGRGISMAHGEAPETIRVIGASKGSIIISLLSAYSIAKTASTIIMETLKIIEKIYDIKKKAEEVKALKLSNNEAENALESAVTTERDNGIENIINSSIENIGIDRESEGDKVNALSSAIKKLADFIEKGGEVDFVMPDEAEENDEEDDKSQERKNLRVMFKEVRKIEQKIQQIEHQDP